MHQPAARECRHGIWAGHMICSCSAVRSPVARHWSTTAASNRRGHSDNYRPLHICQGGCVPCLFLARTLYYLARVSVACFPWACRRLQLGCGFCFKP
ncbi:hypothetical protein CGRA01v4_07579 [Colletotrichum graminicola]|nr:hypothetical protein CGRA01v4_07579 [Colletotrichum graminicola]